MIKAVILDIDNTLYDYDAAHAAAFRSLTEYAAEHFGIAPEDFEALHTEAYRIQRERCVTPCAAVHNRMIRYQIILEMLGRPFLPAREMDALYWETLMNHIARELGVDALAFKEMHIAKQGDLTSTAGRYHFPVPVKDQVM